jgi:hypothetical protein
LGRDERSSSDQKPTFQKPHTLHVQSPSRTTVSPHWPARHGTNLILATGTSVCRC